MKKSLRVGNKEENFLFAEMDHFKGPLALVSEVNSLGSPQEGDTSVGGLQGDLECPRTDTDVLLAAIPALLTTHGALFVAALEKAR